MVPAPVPFALLEVTVFLLALAGTLGGIAAVLRGFGEIARTYTWCRRSIRDARIAQREEGWGSGSETRHSPREDTLGAGEGPQQLAGRRQRAAPRATSQRPVADRVAQRYLSEKRPDRPP
jgi:hypothetical protein